LSFFFTHKKGTVDIALPCGHLLMTSLSSCTGLECIDWLGFNVLNGRQTPLTFLLFLSCTRAGGLFFFFPGVEAPIPE
jgi:hypothetical protein